MAQRPVVFPDVSTFCNDAPVHPYIAVSLTMMPTAQFPMSSMSITYAQYTRPNWS